MTNEAADCFGLNTFIYLFISPFFQNQVRNAERGLKQSRLASGRIFWRRYEPLKTNKKHRGWEWKQQLGYQHCCDHPPDSNPCSSAHCQNTCQKSLLPRNCWRKSWTLWEFLFPRNIRTTKYEHACVTVWSRGQYHYHCRSCWWTVPVAQPQLLYTSENSLKNTEDHSVSTSHWLYFQSVSFFIGFPLFICQCCI